MKDLFDFNRLTQSSISIWGKHTDHTIGLRFTSEATIYKKFQINIRHHSVLYRLGFPFGRRHREQNAVDCLRHGSEVMPSAPESSLEGPLERPLLVSGPQAFILAAVMWVFLGPCCYQVLLAKVAEVRANQRYGRHVCSATRQWLKRINK